MSFTILFKIHTTYYKFSKKLIYFALFIQNFIFHLSKKLVFITLQIFFLTKCVILSLKIRSAFITESKIIKILVLNEMY